jgi:L-ribulokinase
MEEKLVIGIDFGTDSARGILLNALTAEVLSSHVAPYKRWNQGLYCFPEQEIYRQHPLDYMEAMDDIFSNLFTGLSTDAVKQVIAIGTNTTGSTPVAVDRQGNPLALHEEFESNPNAMFVLWKDHSAKKEADKINELAKKWTIDYTQYSGGIYSSEWFWSKILHINTVDKSILEHAFTWVEQSDWIPNYLVGNNNASLIKRNRCAAGHKAMWNENHDGLPSAEFLCTLDPSFYHLINRFYQQTYTSDEVCGAISSNFADKYGFNTDTLITVGGIDAHHGAVGAGIQPYTLVKVIGTSTCDMLVIPNEDNPALVPGICGQVDGSIEPGMVGFEAGQSAFGDVYNWLKKTVLNPVHSILSETLQHEQKQILEQQFFAYLTAEASRSSLAADDLVFTDFFNGRRTPDADFTKQAIGQGFDLSTNAGQIFKALVESTAFGSKAIMDRFISNDVPIQSIIATGGIASKSPYVIQVLANVLNRDIDVVDSDQTCALGSAIFAAVLGKVYENVDEAKKILAARVINTFKPNIDNHNIYIKLYERYQLLTQI